MYTDPVSAKKYVKILQLVLLSVFISMTVYLVDYFVLPTYNDSDSLNYNEFSIYTIPRYRSVVDLGGKVVTKKGYVFNTKYNYPRFESEIIVMEISPIFNTVKVVKTNDVDHSHTLESSLNLKLTLGFFILTYLVIIGNLFMLNGKNEMKTEDLMKSLMSSVVFLGVLYLCWGLHN